MAGLVVTGMFGACAAHAVSVRPAARAEGVCADSQLSITFNQPPVAGSSGSIRVYRADGALVDSIDLASPASAQRSIGGALSDAGTLHLFNYHPILVAGNTAIITLHRQLAYGQSYTVAIDPGVLTAAGEGFDGIPVQSWRFTTKTTAPSVSGGSLSVASDGSGDFCTVQGAIDLVPIGNTSPITINVRPGAYNEIDYILPTKPFITIRGDDRDRTVIQYANNDAFNVAGQVDQCPDRRVPGTPDLYNCWRSLFGEEASDFTLENITLHNITPYAGSQAEAFRGNNDRILLNRVTLLSFQDTVRLQGSGLVTNSYIEGDVDFTWGTGAAFYQESELRSLHPGYIAQVRNDSTANGNFYVNDRLTRAAGVADGSVYLSRIEPLRFPDSEAIFINDAMDAHINPAGFQLNPAGMTCAQAPRIRFLEYDSSDLSGTLMTGGNRLACSHQVTAEAAAMASDPANVLGGWVPYTVNVTAAGVAPGPTPPALGGGAAVTVNWTTPTAHSANDAIGLYHAADSDQSPLAMQTIPAGSTGVLGFTLPPATGQYQFRYFNAFGRRVASSNVVGVPRLCDATGDGKVDLNDINAILAARGARVAPGDVRNTSGNSVIGISDARICVQHCDHAQCRIQ